MERRRPIAIRASLRDLFDGSFVRIARPLIQPGDVACGVDGGGQVEGGDPRRVEADGGRLRCQVDLGAVDAVDLLEEPGDPVDAGRAGHPLDGERDDLDGRGGRGGHGLRLGTVEDTPREYPRTPSGHLSSDQ